MSGRGAPEAAGSEFGWPSNLIWTCPSHASAHHGASPPYRSPQEANLDEPSLIDSLLSLVLGAQPSRSSAQPAAASRPCSHASAHHGASPFPTAASESDPVHGRTAASTAVRLRAIGLLCRSVGAANRFPGTIQVRWATDCLSPDGHELPFPQWPLIACHDAH
jgi:hypothetical protein